MRPGKLFSLGLGPVLLMACGGGGNEAKRARTAGSEPSATSGETHDSIGADAIAQGGLAGVGMPSGTSSPSLAGSLKAERVEGKIKLDGVPLEWPARTAAGTVIKGSPTGADKVAMTFGL